MDLNDLYEFWFDAMTNIWFDQNDRIDAFIKDAFAHLLNYRIDFYASSKELVAQIVLFDQVPRHVYRQCDKELADTIINKYLQDALLLAEYIIFNKHIYKSLSVAEWMFVLLPLRHTMKQKQIFRVAKLAWERIEKSPPKNEQEVALYRSFIRATYQRCPLEQSFQIVNLHKPIAHNWFASATHILQHVGDYKPIQKLPRLCEVFQAAKVALQKVQDVELVISISGGVDSMVMSFALTQLARLMPSRAIFKAVHINYKNKEHCDEEESFVVWWCQQLEIPITVRRIHEIQREQCRKQELRETYESYTRNVRYNTYKAICTDIPFVFLGHNKDDCFENIFCGITHCRKYENLEGMSDFSVVDDIAFIRPFLKIPKALLRSFAKRYNIPHLYDSTPAWCQRGRIRDVIVPTLKAWNKVAIDSFHELSHALTELHSCMQIYVDSLVSKTQANMLEMTLSEAHRIPEIAWREYLLRQFKVQISKASLKNMTDKVRSRLSYNIVVTKHLRINKTVSNNNVLLHFYTDSAKRIREN